MTSAPRKPNPRRMPPAGGREAIAALLGAAAGVIASFFTLVTASILIGWDVAAVGYLAWTWSATWRMEPTLTAEIARREDPSRPASEIAVLASGTAMLAAVGLALIKAGREAGWMQGYLLGLGVFSVVVSWLTVHTVFMLRYGRAYYGSPTGGIDFNEPEPPAYVDFAYFSFTIGMTFQVSDTNITSREIRRITLYHALLSFLFGAVILGLAINVVASLLK